MSELILAIAIGALICICLIATLRLNREKAIADKENVMEDHEAEAVDTPFIEIDPAKFLPESDEGEGDSVHRLKRKLLRFKLRNRFYK